ncbi:MAG: exodeoxyribonuclease VII small subunit [Lachnospiraceae bacterium]|nr:exodeoxyribonuclease VII small subunit [Lachnospiraceae bacterium]
MKINEGFEQLEEILSRMEKDDQPIEEAFADYEKGMKLIHELNAKLTDVEKRLLVLNTQTGELEEDEEDRLQ